MMRAGLVLAAGTVQSTPFLERLEPARAAGFTEVSMFAADFEAMAERGIDAAEIRARVSDAGLGISEVEIVGNWLPGEPRKRGMPAWLIGLLQRMTPERVVEIAAAVGARGITVGDMLDPDCDLGAAAAAFARVCACADQASLHVALEFIPTGRVATLDQGWEVVRRAGSRNGGLLVDSWHFFRSGSSLEQLASIPGEAIVSVQIGDAPAAVEADLDHAMSHDRLLPGEGDLDLPGFLRALAQTGSRAPIAVEVFSDALAAEPVAEVAARCADRARRLVDQRSGA